MERVQTQIRLLLFLSVSALFVCLHIAKSQAESSYNSAGPSESLDQKISELENVARQGELNLIKRNETVLKAMGALTNTQDSEQKNRLDNLIADANAAYGAFLFKKATELNPSVVSTGPWFQRYWIHFNGIVDERLFQSSTIGQSKGPAANSFWAPARILRLTIPKTRESVEDYSVGRFEDTLPTETVERKLIIVGRPISQEFFENQNLFDYEILVNPGQKTLGTQPTEDETVQVSRNDADLIKKILAQQDSRNCIGLSGEPFSYVAVNPHSIDGNKIKEGDRGQVNCAALEKRTQRGGPHGIIHDEPFVVFVEDGPTEKVSLDATGQWILRPMEVIEPPAKGSAKPKGTGQRKGPAKSAPAKKVSPRKTPAKPIPPK